MISPFECAAGVGVACLYRTEQTTTTNILVSLVSGNHIFLNFRLPASFPDVWAALGVIIAVCPSKKLKQTTS